MPKHRKPGPSQIGFKFHGLIKGVGRHIDLRRPADGLDHRGSRRLVRMADGVRTDIELMERGEL